MGSSGRTPEPCAYADARSRLGSYMRSGGRSDMSARGAPSLMISTPVATSPRRTALARLKKTVVMVTQDLAEAAFLAAQAVLLRDGRIAQQAPVEELARAPADEFVARFVRAHRRSP